MKRDKLIGAVLLVVALSAISGLALIAAFIFREGVPIILRVGAGQFFFSTDWEPSLGHFGILSMIGGSLASPRVRRHRRRLQPRSRHRTHPVRPSGLAAALKPAIELLAGIPSVVYGFVGVVTLVPLIRHLLGGPGSRCWLPRSCWGS